MGWAQNYEWSGLKDILLNYIYGSGENQGFKEWWFGYNPDEEDIKNFKQIKELADQYGITQSQFENILNTYKGDSIFDPFNGTYPSTTILNDLQELVEWDKYVGKRPEMPNAQDYFQEASDIINAENRGLEDLYDQMFSNSKNLLEEQLADNNAMFADYRNQTLTNEAMVNQAIAGSARFELDRQKRMAISRGASAAQRLVTNINTQLGLQAQAAQQSLNTSNALAQQLLAHRQAQAGLRQDYMNAQNQHINNLTGLRKGNAERILNYQNGKLGQAMDAYDIDMQRYNDRLSSIQGTNPWAGAYTSYRTKQDTQQDTNVL